MNLVRRPWRRTLSIALSSLALVATGVTVASPAQAANIVTPGSFTGYGFDQCLAPTQAKMDAWLRSSPFWAVGIYISGDSRGCPDQPNLTPTWISTQLRSGWRLLPITLGPQAWCTTRQKYLDDVRINPDPTSGYSKARAQGRAEAVKTVDVAKSLGIAPKSTLWYDIEAFDISKTNCRESALSFLSAWTNKLHLLGYVSGVYSSAASGIKMMDDAQTYRPGTYSMPDRVWIGDWNGDADIYSSYVRNTSWMPHKRVHQYRGGHNETYGGVTINIDSNYMSLGRGSVAPAEPTYCGGVKISFAAYHFQTLGNSNAEVKALQCLLTRKGFFSRSISGTYNDATATAVKAYKQDRGFRVTGSFSRRNWTAILSEGSEPILKYGSAGHAVRRLQRALNAAAAEGLTVGGVDWASTTAAVRRYQGAHGLATTGVVTPGMWDLLQRGVR